MSSLIFLVIFAGFIILSVLLANRAFKKGTKAKKILVTQVLSFLFMTIVCSVGTATINASAETSKAAEISTQTVASETTAQENNKAGWGFIAMAITMGLGTLGTGFAVASAAPAAIGATSENPKIFGKALIFVVLAEGIIVFPMLISLFIYGLVG